MRVTWDEAEDSKFRDWVRRNFAAKFFYNFKMF